MGKAGREEYTVDSLMKKGLGYAAIHGVTTAIKHFDNSKEFPGLNETTIPGWKDIYMS